MTSAEELYERTAELDALQSGLARARSGRGQVIVAMGPAGIGKTRLLTEAGRMAAADCDVAVARADSLHQHLPFAVMRQLLQPLVTQLSASQRQCRMSPAASRALQDVTDSAALPQAEEGVTESLLALTFELCKDKPLVFVVDDLQWADTASVKFLFHLLPLIERQRCCVIAALDDNDEDAPALLNTITADRRCHLLRLSSLGPQTIATIVEASSACSGSPPPDPSFLHACHSATAGNPLFLGELLRLLAREQAAPSADTVARLAPVNAQTVQDRVRTALEQLPKDSGSLTRAPQLSVRAPPWPRPPAWRTCRWMLHSRPWRNSGAPTASWTPHLVAMSASSIRWCMPPSTTPSRPTRAARHTDAQPRFCVPTGSRKRRPSTFYERCRAAASRPFTGSSKPQSWPGPGAHRKPPRCTCDAAWLNPRMKSSARPSCTT